MKKFSFSFLVHKQNVILYLKYYYVAFRNKYIFKCSLYSQTYRLIERKNILRTFLILFCVQLKIKKTSIIKIQVYESWYFEKFISIVYEKCHILNESKVLGFFLIFRILFRKK